MAEALFRELLEERDDLKEELSVTSAGIYPYEGDPANYEAVEVMKQEFGIDISSHRARILDDSDMKDAYLILVMTVHHREMILDIYPEAADRVYTLKDFAEEDEESPDVCDPYGNGYKVYKDCASEIEALLLNIIDKIQ